MKKKLERGGGNFEYRPNISSWRRTSKNKIRGRQRSEELTKKGNITAEMVMKICTKEQEILRKLFNVIMTNEEWKLGISAPLFKRVDILKTIEDFQYLIR